MKDWQKITRADFVTTFSIYQIAQSTFGRWEGHHEMGYQCIETKEFHTTVEIEGDFFDTPKNRWDLLLEKLEQDAWIKNLEAMKKLKEQYGEGYKVVLADFKCKTKGTVI